MVSVAADLVLRVLGFVLEFVRVGSVADDENHEKIRKIPKSEKDIATVTVILITVYDHGTRARNR